MLSVPIESILQEKLVGNSYTITTYDNLRECVCNDNHRRQDRIVQGEWQLETSSYDSDGNVITGDMGFPQSFTITIDGKEIESCGDTC